MTEQRIIFLDIDGPMIPGGMMFINPNASFDRDFSPICMAILKQMIKAFDAKVVTNTYHNAPHPSAQNGLPIRDALIQGGLKAEDFHPVEDSTGFPHKLHHVRFSEQPCRMKAINQWIERNGGIRAINWIALDDEKFTDNERLLKVSYEAGITPQHFRGASEIFNMPMDFD